MAFPGQRPGKELGKWVAEDKCTVPLCMLYEF